MNTFADLAEQHLDIAMRSGDEYMVRCIFHDDSKASMQFNVAKGLYVCFACGAHGSAKTIQRQLGIRWTEGENDLVDIRKRLDALKDQESGPRYLILDETFLDRFNFAKDYWTKDRKLRPATVEAFDLGYDPLGDNFGPYVTIPVRNVHGGLLGVIKRYLGKNVELRYRYPKGFQRASNLFASWLIEEDAEADHVALLEGAVDCMSVWQAGFPAVAAYGNSLSPAQVRVLKRLGVTQVTVFGDNDLGGQQLFESATGWHVRRNHKTREILHRKYQPETDLRRDFIVRRVQWNRGMPKDANQLSPRQIRAMLRGARTVL